MTTKTADAPAVSAGEELAAAQAELAALEHELRIDNPQAQRDARTAADTERLRELRIRNNHVTQDLLPGARVRIAAAVAAHRTAAESAEVVLPTGMDLAAALEDARQLVAALEGEQAALPERMQAAAFSADPAFIALRHRLDAIPPELMASRVRLLRLRIADAEATEANARAEQPALEKDLAQKRAALERARAGHAAAHHAHALIVAAARDAHGETRQLRYELAELLNEQGRDKGPVVRSAIHARRGLGDG